MKATINLNEYVYVRLTPIGKEILRRDKNHIYAQRNHEDVYRFQLYSLMRIFGEHLFLGMAEVPFEHNEIIACSDFGPILFENIDISK